MEITIEQRKMLLEYLPKRQFNEVYNLIAMLTSLKHKTKGTKKDEVTPKN